jgi:ArsR family transcriptional regulator
VARQAVEKKERNGRATRPATSPFGISDRVIKDLKRLFKLLADESRLRILLALLRKDKMHVSDLRQMLGTQSQPAVSHHLTLMRTLGVLDFIRDGRHNYYHIAPGYIRGLLDAILADSASSTPTLQLDNFVLTMKRR